MLDAKVGDELVVDGPHLGDLPRRGEVLEVLNTGGVVHYRLRWDDGTECIFFPSSDTHVVRLDKKAKTR